MLEATAQGSLGTESKEKLEEGTTEQKPEEDGGKTDTVGSRQNL